MLSRQPSTPVFGPQEMLKTHVAGSPLKGNLATSSSRRACEAELGWTFSSPALPTQLCTSFFMKDLGPGTTKLSKAVQPGLTWGRGCYKVNKQARSGPPALSPPPQSRDVL